MNGDQRSEVERVRAAIAANLGLGMALPIGQEPQPVAKIEVILTNAGSVTLNYSGDELVTRFLFSKGLAIYEMQCADQVRAQMATRKEIGSADCTQGEGA